jgi:hypothetical protein
MERILPNLAEVPTRYELAITSRLRRRSAWAVPLLATADEVID